MGVPVAASHALNARFALGKSFACATATSMVLVDDDLAVLEGEGAPNPAVRFPPK
jgi:hypothetical protein